MLFSRIDMSEKGYHHGDLGGAVGDCQHPQDGGDGSCWRACTFKLRPAGIAATLATEPGELADAVVERERRPSIPTCSPPAAMSPGE
jgi:hypothetical protein